MLRLFVGAFSVMVWIMAYIPAANAQKSVLPTPPEVQSAFDSTSAGFVAMEKKKYEEAIKHFKTALQYEELGMAWAGLARSYYALNRRQEALQAYQTLLLPFPGKNWRFGSSDDADDQLNYADLLLEKRNWTEAVSAYRQAASSIHFDPNSEWIAPFTDFKSNLVYPRTLQAMIHLVRGMRKEHQGDDDAALAAYQEAVRLDPRQDVSLYFLGRRLYSLGKYEEAVEMLEKASRCTRKESRSAAKIEKKLKEAREYAALQARRKLCAQQATQP
ncbi:MAG: hypothetical protein OHK0029_34780 [Armatimonadaceae bacterium]